MPQVQVTLLSTLARYLLRRKRRSSTNDAVSALKLAMEAQERFARGSQFESEWRAWLIASRASQQLGDKNKAEEQLRNAQNARSKLEQQWGADAFKQYTLRPDIQVYSQ